MPPIPDPRQLLALLPRTVGLLDEVEALVRRIEQTRQSADALIGRIGTTQDSVEAILTTVEETQEAAAAVVGRIAGLTERMEPSLTTLQPTLERLAETTDPHEVDALIAVIDELPHLAEIVETMSTVAPDLHELLRTSKEINSMLAKIPFLNRDG